MRKYLKQGGVLLLIAMLALSLCTGCGNKDSKEQQKQQTQTETQQEQTQQEKTEPTEPETTEPEWNEENEWEPTEPDWTEENEWKQTEDSKQKESDKDAPDRNGIYNSKEDVALYLHVYGELPHNYMTKKEAKAMGWDGGPLERYAKGMCIGGDHFGNYEGNLPDGNYYECDIDTLGKSSRGAKRLVYDDENIYYTDDHYRTFEQLYDRNGRL